MGEAATRMTVVSVLALAARPGAEAELARRFAQLEVFERARELGGFRGGRLLRSVDEPARFLIIADWTSAEAYGGWLRSSTRDELSAELVPLLAAEVVAGELFVDDEGESEP
jgi:heme-degrading monooxygenase HmoA